MGPGVPNYNGNSNQHPHVSDEDNQSLSSTPNRAHSPIHLYENPGNYAAPWQQHVKSNKDA